MARTRQTSKKTTGGPAKRGQLPHFKQFTGSTGTKQIVTSFMPKAAAVGLSVSTVPKSSQAPDSEAILNAVSQVTPKPFLHNIYCFFCRDGGKLYCCATCVRTICQRCLIVPEDLRARVEEEDVRFICPGCHESRGTRSGNKNVGMKPYFGFEDTNHVPILTVPATISSHIESTSRSQVCSDPILILHFILKTLEPFASCARVMRDVVQPFTPEGNMEYHEIVFDIGTSDKVLKHARSMKKLVDRFRLVQYGRVEVFVFTHSETSRGDIWGGFEDEPKGRRQASVRSEPVSYTVSDFFRGLFAGGIEQYVKGSTLWVLACGHMLRELKAFNLFKACVTHYEVEHAFAFTAEKFHACLTSAFITAYAERVLIEGFEVQEVIRDLLLVSPRLGAHTSIVHFHVANAFRRRNPTILEYTKGLTQQVRDPSQASMTVSNYTFFHKTNRPFGDPLPYQCAGCKCVRPWECVSSEPQESRFACQNCHHTITFKKPNESQIILFSQGYLGTSNVSGKLVKKGRGSGGFGWLMSVTVEPATPLLDDYFAD
ncbi:hypothetical protein EDD22DRAFT_908473 [Suillus occidentalis]|nr:hypothetical protein EDD22DRAFT_908473 [Suillus occidentalis]